MAENFVDESIISSQSQEFQEVFLRKNPLEEKFKNLEKNVRLLLENDSISTNKPIQIQKFNKKDQELDTLIFLLKGIKRECEVIKVSQEEKKVGFLRDYAEKLEKLECEVKKFEDLASNKRILKTESFTIFFSEGKIKQEKFCDEFRVRAFGKNKFDGLKENFGRFSLENREEIEITLNNEKLGKISEKKVGKGGINQKKKNSNVCKNKML